MRARNIKPGLFKNDELAECDIAARYLFTGLWCMADREGRMDDRPKRIKAEILPYDDVDIDDLLEQLERNGFILRYEVSGERYIQVVNFPKHQRPHSSEVDSEIPPPSAHSAPANTPDKDQRSTKLSRTVNQGEPDSEPNSQAPRPDTGYLIPESNNTSEVADAPTDSPSPVDPEHEELARDLDRKIRNNNPKAKPKSERTIKNWANEVRLMVERDDRSLDDIRAVLDWSQNHPTQANGFSWRNNILSMGKLREKFDRLWLDMQSDTGSRSPPSQNGHKPDLEAWIAKRKADLDQKIAMAEAMDDHDALVRFREERESL